MWYPAKVTEAATAEPISLVEAKAYCHGATAGDDAKINGIIAAARDYVERYCCSRMAPQTVEIKCDGFSDMAHLPEAPVVSIESIAYLDRAGASQTLPTSVFELRADGLDAAVVRKYGQVWPTTQPGSRITVTAVVGYDEVPQAVKSAMLVLIAQLYNLSRDEGLVRSETVEGVGSRQMVHPDVFGRATNAVIEGLLAPYRVFLL